MNQEQIGQFIAKCRKEKNLTQSELAEILGVTDRAVSNWENAKNLPDVSLFKPLCHTLGITLNELLSGQKISQEEYQEKFEENIVNTIQYSNKKINKKNKILIIASIIMLIFLLFLSLFLIDVHRMRNNQPVFFSTWGFLYSPPVDLSEEKIYRAIRTYLLELDSDNDRNLYLQKSFVSIEQILIEEKDNKYDVYLWGVTETYYEKDNEIIQDSGSSLPYKFTLEKRNDDYIVLEYKIPRDGYYSEDIKTIFPKAVRTKINEVQQNGTVEKLIFRIQEQKAHYYQK